MKKKDFGHEHPDSSLSANIVARLQKEGMTLKEIGDSMGGLSHSFISLVKNGRRSLTMARLKRLEKTLQRPLPIIFLQAIEESSIPRELRPQYKLLRQMLNQAAEEREFSTES